MAVTINASTTAGLVNTADTSGILQLQTANTTAVTVDASQNVGIGTATPASRISATGSSATTFAALTLRNSNGAVNSSAVLNFEASGGTEGDSGSSAAQIRGIRTASGTSGALAFWTSDAGVPAERARIDSNGYLLLGLTASSTAAQQQVKYTTATMGARYINVSSTSSDVMDFVANSAQVGRINTSGSSTSYVTSSDYRLKENIAPMTGALAKISQLKPVTYKWKSDNTDGQGFIAHELQTIIPDAVVGVKDAIDENGNPKYQGIDTSFLVATLTAAIQEQQALITQLQADVAALKGTP